MARHIKHGSAPAPLRIVHDATGTYAFLASIGELAQGGHGPAFCCTTGCTHKERVAAHAQFVGFERRRIGPFFEADNARAFLAAGLARAHLLRPSGKGGLRWHILQAEGLVETKTTLLPLHLLRRGQELLRTSGNERKQETERENCFLHD